MTEELELSARNPWLVVYMQNGVEKRTVFTYALEAVKFIYQGEYDGSISTCYIQMDADTNEKMVPPWKTEDTELWDVLINAVIEGFPEEAHWIRRGPWG